MEIGISTATFFGKEYTENTLKLISDMGIGVCEVFLTTFSEYRAEFVDELKKRKDKLKVYSIHSLNQHFEPELFNPVARTREDSEYFFREMCYAAKTLDAQVYTFHGPARLKKRKYVFDYAWLAKRLTELQSLLDESGGGCRLSYENVHWTFFSEPEFFENLKERCEVNACLDIKQAMQAKISCYDFLRCMGDRLKNVHLCDYDDNGKLAVPGKGKFDFVTLFKYLRDIGYEGPCMMELYAGDYKSYDEVARGYEYLNNCIAKI